MTDLEIAEDVIRGVLAEWFSAASTPEPEAELGDNLLSALREAGLLKED